jgi:hypothetical protein
LEGKASASFLKKRSKKLLVTAGVGTVRANARRSESFFASFLSKKEALAFSGNGEAWMSACAGMTGGTVRGFG